MSEVDSSGSLICDLWTSCYWPNVISDHSLSERNILNPTPFSFLYIVSFHCNISLTFPSLGGREARCKKHIVYLNYHYLHPSSFILSFLCQYKSCGKKKRMCHLYNLCQNSCPLEAIVSIGSHHVRWEPSYRHKGKYRMEIKDVDDSTVEPRYTNPY